MTARTLGLIAFAVLAFAPVVAATAPARAASDGAMLQSYAGNYTGTGQVASNPPQSVRCRLTLAPSGANAVDYTGRCSAGGVSFSMNGIITAQGGRISAAMSGNGMGASNMSMTVAGTKRAGGVVFSSKTHDTSTGHDRTITSTLSLLGGKITIDFSMVDNKMNKTYAGSIPFAKVGGK